MRTSEADILIVPGLGGSGSDHWQTRWERQLSTARRVEQDDWDAPDRQTWTARIIEAVAGCRRPVILIAHSLGVSAVVQAAAGLPTGRVKGAFLVAYADVEDEERRPDTLAQFAPLPLDRFPFPSVLVASRNDPYCAYKRAEDLAYSWGSAIVDAGESGHLNPESGHGPWPEGLMRFAGFLKRL